mmetsp:Transcript_22297/g.16761  ORF Transcript_22297/g.16761 Transcript_22297/m.16761 type:complete len:196 (+) Transcript_22297:263-850(+)
MCWNHDYDRFEDHINAAGEWLIEQVNKGGSYRSTQATMMAVLALDKYFKTLPMVNGKGKIEFKMNDEVVHVQDFDSSTIETITYDFTTYVTENQRDFEPGDRVDYEISIVNFTQTSNFSKDFRMQYIFFARYFDDQNLDEPESDLNLILTSKFADYQLEDPSLVGTRFGYRVQIDNSNPTEGSGMVLLVLRLPSC